MIIVMISIKGGAGKSTILVNLAASLARQRLSVLVIDADEHSKTARRWAVRRQGKKKAPQIPLLVRTPGEELAQELESIKKQYNYILVDLHGADTPENREVLLSADKLVIPFKPSQGELDTFGDLATLLRDLKELRPQVDHIPILTEASTLTSRDKKDAREFLAAKGMAPLTAVLHNRQAYKDCIGTGLGVCEMTNDKATAEFDMVFAEFLLRSNNLINPFTEPLAVN